MQVLRNSLLFGFIIGKVGIDGCLDVLFPCYEGGAVSSLAIHDFVAVGAGDWSHTYRVENTLTADRVSEFGEALLVEILTGVVVARLNESERDCGFLYVCGVGLNCCCFHNLSVLDV